MDKKLDKEFNGKSGKYRKGVYAGTFDPITLGHMEIIERAAAQVDHLVIAIGTGEGKTALFSYEERKQMIEADVAELAEKLGVTIEVQPFEGLLVDFAKKIGAHTIFRGLRSNIDFNYEYSMAGTNKMLAPEVETNFFLCTSDKQFVSSSTAKEIAKHDPERLDQFVTPAVQAALKQKFAQKKPAAGPRIQL